MKNKRYKDMTDKEKEDYHKEYSREYYKKNRERMIKLTKESQKRNKDKILKRNREKREANRDEWREYYRNYNSKFRSPESQKTYEENKLKGHKNIGERDEAWHKAYLKGKNKGKRGLLKKGEQIIKKGKKRKKIKKEEKGGKNDR